MEDIKIFRDINPDIKRLRYEVFCIEQNIKEEDEWDGLDKDMYHFCLYIDNVLVSYCRCYLTDIDAHIGRVITKKAYRLKGYGRKIIEYAENFLKADRHVFKLGAQLSAIPFYEKLGYSIVSDVFLDAGIPHKMMEKCIK